MRWGICALLFFATTINYVDRSVLGILAPTLRTEIGWTDVEYGRISAAFTLAYAIGFLFAGWFIDRVGTRIGYALYLIVWSIAAAAHALAATPFGFGVARFALGLGESGNFPAAIKTVAEWFPRRERAFATGIFNAGSNVGVIVAPLVVPWLTLHWSWRVAFAATGPDRISSGCSSGGRCIGRRRSIRGSEREERQHIESDPPEPAVSVSWAELLRHRQAWAFAVGKFLTDSVWWFYLFWFPLFMADTFGFDLKNIGLPMVTVYLLADVGSVGGGWLSSNLLEARLDAKRRAQDRDADLRDADSAGHDGAARRRIAWVAVWLVGLAAAAHQGFSANIFTIASDMFPSRAVGSVVGFGGFAGAMGGFLMNLGAGWFRENQGSYVTMFTIAGVAYLVAIAAIHLLAPRLEPVRLSS